MFLIPPETSKSFKRSILHLYKKCRNESGQIIAEKLPETLKAGEAVK